MCPGFIKLFIITFIGVLPESLQIFLETNVPKVGKMSKVILGVIDSKLGASINEKLGLKIQHTGFVLEILRGLFGLILILLWYNDLN